jgi:uncharacterized membrane protein YdfJ with MMPL/SSD domain
MEQSTCINRRKFLIQTIGGTAALAAGAGDGLFIIKKITRIDREVVRDAEENGITRPSSEELNDAHNTLYKYNTAREYKKQNRDKVNKAVEVQAQQKRFNSALRELVEERRDEIPSATRMIGDTAAVIGGFVAIGEALMSRLSGSRRVEHTRDSQPPQKA